MNQQHTTVLRQTSNHPSRTERELCVPLIITRLQSVMEQLDEASVALMNRLESVMNNDPRPEKHDPTGPPSANGRWVVIPLR